MAGSRWPILAVSPLMLTAVVEHLEHVELVDPTDEGFGHAPGPVAEDQYAEAQRSLATEP